MERIKLILPVALAIICLSSDVYSKTNANCDLSEQETFREDLIEVADLACDDFLDCVLILKFPKEYQQSSFKKISLLGEENSHAMMPALLTSEVKDHLSSHIYGSQDFLTSLKFKIVFEPIKGCSHWSTLILE